MGPKVSDDVHKDRKDVDEGSIIPKRLILCFDGTGNSFLGTPGDTNIVKLLDMFDRSAPRQMHYYQPGIGTYTKDGSINGSALSKMKKSISQTIDSGLGTSFEDHVIAGYRFLMRYYNVGDRIYIFGFSRGAFTARFLARMVSHVGLLSMGNEEMVPFAYKVYQDYEMWKPTRETAKAYMLNFRSTFCRSGASTSANDETHDDVDCCTESDDSGESTSKQGHVDQNASSTAPWVSIKIHFLGLFDTVNSVGTFDVPFTGTIPMPDVAGTAEHVRHAVAIDERRVKFKAALLAQDKLSSEAAAEDHKEVWFPGNHGDIGGGWPAENETPEEKPGWMKRLGLALTGHGSPKKTEVSNDKTDDWFQLSDIALKWMVDELDELEERHTDHVRWNVRNKTSFIQRFKKHRHHAIRGLMHDTMAFGGGSGFFKTIMWKLMEFLPLIKRWEYLPKKEKWDYVTFPLNMGGRRDIPPGALFHHSVIERLQAFGDSYFPHNDFNLEGDRNKDKRAKPFCDVARQAIASKGGWYFEPAEDSAVVKKHGRKDTDRIYKLKFQ